MSAGERRAPAVAQQWSPRGALGMTTEDRRATAEAAAAMAPLRARKRGNRRAEGAEGAEGAVVTGPPRASGYDD